MPSNEASQLDRIERQAAFGLAFALGLVLVGASAIATSPSATAERIGGAAIFCGIFLAWSFGRWRGILPQAREVLKEAPRDLLLERRFQLSRYEGSRARLWALDSQERPLAWFGWKQWSKPTWMIADREPARVYGAPRSRAVVVVSCSRGLLVGQINLSRFDTDLDPELPPRGMR
jgi:hypothetical protein